MEWRECGSRSATLKFDADQTAKIRAAPQLLWSKPEVLSMPTDSLILSIAVCGVFILFAAILAWVDHRTADWQRSKTSEKSIAGAKVDPIHKKAACRDSRSSTWERRVWSEKWPIARLGVLFCSTVH